MPDKKPIEDKEVGKGVGLGIALNVGLALLLYILSEESRDFVFLFALFLIGVTQLVVIVPALIVARVKDCPGIVKGLLIVAGLTGLGNALCCGIIFA